MPIIVKFHSRNPSSSLFPLHFLLTRLLRASHSRNIFSSLFSLHFCLPDCYVLRTPAILSQVFSHYIFCLPDCYVLRTPAIFSQIYSHYIFCLPDCCVLCTPAILPKHSHIVKLSLHFMLILGACPKSSHPPLCKHRWMTGLVHCKQKKKKRSHHFMFSLIKWWLPIYSFKIDVLFITNFFITNT